MPRTKQSRNPFGSIFSHKVTIEGKKVLVYDARKRYRDADGNKKQKFKRCRSNSEAMVALANFQTEIETDKKSIEKAEAPAENTFFDLTAYFRREYLKEATIVDNRIIEGYRGSIKKLEAQIKDFEEFFGNAPLTQINYEKIRALKIFIATSPKKHKYSDDPPKPATVNRKLAMLNKIMNVAVQLGWLPFNPFRAGKPLIKKSDEVQRTRMLTFEEERELLKACVGEDVVKTQRRGIDFEMKFTEPRRHLLLIIVMALDTAMRQGELFKIERGQIDLENKTLSLRAEQTKSFRARTMPMSARLHALLTEYFENVPLALDDKVFRGIGACSTSFGSALKRARIDGFRFHDLRHTAISWMDLAGITEMVKKNIAGHSTGDAHQIYHNLSADVLRDARQKLDNFRREIDRRFKRQSRKSAA